MNSTLSPYVHRAPPHSLFSDNLCDCNSFLCIASDHIGLSVFCGRYISIDLSSLCPVLPNSLNVSLLKSSFVSGHHFTLTFHNSLNSFHPHPHCVVSSSLHLGLKSLFCLDITTHELQGGNSSVLGMPSCWREICHYRRSKARQPH